MKRKISIFCCITLVCSLVACSRTGTEALHGSSMPEVTQTEADSLESRETEHVETESSELVESAESFSVQVQEEDIVEKINVQIGSTVFTATLEKNAAVDELVEMLQEAPVVIKMHDYAGFEKVGSLGRSLSTDGNTQMTTQTGDIVLYNGSQIVIFYGSNAWSYTKLGSIDDLSGWTQALGNGDVTVTLSVQ